MGIQTILTSESNTWCEHNASMLGTVAQAHSFAVSSHTSSIGLFGEEILFALQISRG